MDRDGVEPGIGGKVGGGVGRRSLGIANWLVPVSCPFRVGVAICESVGGGAETNHVRDK